MGGGRNCYPDSDVLINKYNIRDKEMLEKFEIQKVFAKLLGLDVKPTRVSYTYNVVHLVNIHKYLFGDIYEWAGTFRKENLYKSERVLSGGSAEYADYHEIEDRLEKLFEEYANVDWKNCTSKGDVVSDFLLALWSIHPFRDGNTRTTITFANSFAKEHGFPMDLNMLLERLPRQYVGNRAVRYSVRDTFVLAAIPKEHYPEPEHLTTLIRSSIVSGMKKNINALQSQLDDIER